ncbi:MAG: protein kinase domain-containing protein, partial [Acidobacteriota bacterium]
MPFSAGLRLGSYEVVGLLGAGGMGEVYRARDTRLGRDVAIKVLPASLANDDARLQRFEQEARATSALNHPNILTVHDVGTAPAESGGAPYLVMELLDGEDLRALLGAGPLPHAKAIDYSVQMASGLAAAHEKGIVHRDLKPENVFITADDRVKILDFGLAKLAPLAPEGIAATVATRGPVTDAGTVMGTVGYMSPEQIRGEAADHRSDIFSFGALLYELLSGRRAFHGDTAAETMTAILKQEPAELNAAHAAIGQPVERIVRRCLEKKPERRFQSAHDLGFALSTLTTSSSASMAGAGLEDGDAHARVRAGPARGRFAWLAAVGGLILVALGWAAAYFSRPPVVDVRPVTAAVVPPARSSVGSVAVSPDGRWLAFSAVTGGNMQLWVRALESLSAQALPDTEGASYPFWSPDSRFIGFFAGGKLKKIAVTGGAAQTLCETGVTQGGTWNRDGVIVYAALGFGLYRAPASGGEPTLLMAIDRAAQESNYHSPSFLPDGRHFLYGHWGARPDLDGIYVGSIDGTLKHRLVTAHSDAVYAPPGYLLFVRDGALLARPFDATTRAFDGEPAVIAERVGRVPNMSRGLYSVSDTGVLVYDPILNRQSKQLVWVDRGGSVLRRLDAVGGWTAPSLSPDETRAVADRIDMETDSRDLWLHDTTGSGSSSRFTFDPNDDVEPVWSPDGDRIVWASNRGQTYSLYLKAASGVGQDEPWSASPRLTIPLSWSPDGRFIISYEIDPKTKRDVWVRPLAEDQKPFPILQSAANEIGGPVSPDGRWLAYASDETGSYEVYV